MDDFRLSAQSPAPGAMKDLAAGMAAIPQIVAAGGVAATKVLTFDTNVVATNAITVDGVAFAFVASGATGNQVNVGGSAAASASAFATVFNAATDPAVAAMVANAVGAVVTITHFLKTAAGNASTAAVTGGHVSGAGNFSGGKDVQIDLRVAETDLRVSADATDHYVLPDGQEGQRHTIVATSVGSSGTAVVYYNAGANTATFSNTGKYANFIFLNGDWRALGASATIA